MSRDFSTVVDDFAPERSSASPPGFRFDIKRFISLRLPVILVAGAILAVPLAIAGWVITPVEFTASAQIQYKSTGTGIMESGRVASGDYDKFVSTEIAKLTGDNVLLQVLQNPEISALPSIKEAGDQLTFLKSCISARPYARSELVDVWCTMKSRTEAKRVLEIVLETYNKQVSDEEQTEGSSKLGVLDQRIESIEADLASRRKTIEEMEGELGADVTFELPENTEEATQYREKILEGEVRLKEAENNVNSIKDKLARVDTHQEALKANSNTSIYEFGVEAMVNQDSRVIVLRDELAQMERQLALMRESHPRYAATSKQIETMERNIAAKEAVARADALKTIRGEFTLQVEEAQRKVEDAKLALAEDQSRLETFLKTGQEKLYQVSGDRARLRQLQDEWALDHEWLTSLKTQANSMKLEEEAPARVRIATPAFAPLTQGNTKKLIVAMIGALAGFALAFSIGAVRELLDQQIRSPRDIAHVSNLPLIASIHHMSEDKSLKGADSALLLAQHPASVIADEYRRILARILFPEDNAAEISSLMIVSASPGEGKTSLACNLAVALEQANRKVLLLDLSSQRPTVERTFGLKPSLGITDILNDDRLREELIRRTAFENLGVLGPGSNPAELAGRLASREMMDFLEWADEHFDHTIIDTPPLLLMSDAKLLAPAIDGVLFVVGAGRSTLGMVNRCLRDLDLLRANTIGIVLNGMRSMRGGYMKKNQNLFYSYTNRQEFETAIAGMPEINILDDEPIEPIEAEVVLLPAEKQDQ